MVVIIGSGRLSRALLTLIHCDDVRVYGRNTETVKDLVDQFPLAKQANKDDLNKAEMIIICLPKNAYMPFFEEHLEELSKNVLIVHFATALMEEQVRPLIGGRGLLPCKLVGHAKQMLLDGEGLFAVPSAYDELRVKIEKLFPSITFISLKEEEVLAANQLATEETMKMIARLEKRARELKLPDRVTAQVERQIIPGVVHSYLDDDLGGFAKEIAKRLKEKKGELDEA
ncbi:NAD(P)-binding domain-containing protein [Alkalihalophilus lindianensis]|uniref:NAD(P)-binding domain-containing protein n=1 Tax=Alkalihalophilus lindianensis TaxID=1630542 RepID=A0ABU3XES8_9BACI|nr:NAD(P)-binding domain-containing protein [Alkalihalophilus lindianensis]MDV2686386.1 NAD(P)-binding domain-containing protein [Alkalihalophilus lindianensis]